MFVLALAACSDSPVEPLDATAPVTPLPAAAALNPASPTEPFDAFSADRWYRSTHVLGRGPLMPGNVTVAGGQLRLALDANGFLGAEIGSRATFGAGSYAARLRCGAPAGALCAFFFYQPGMGDAADEIDIEILGASREIWFTTWVRGRRTNHAAGTLPFDPAVAAHDYAIVRTGSRVSFYVDGKQYVEFRKKVPTSRMVLLANAWWPTWLTPTGAATGSLDVDWIDWS
jgi:beta-glucanase (GH16 family)